jgi:mannose/fructose/N-acetylgalactosamine-specific phosphotransferase system component IIB
MDFIIRVDDRLIHGQVTAGWVRPLGIERIILANDEVANDEWEREIYTLAVPPEIEVKIFSIPEAVKFIIENQPLKKTMILINSLKDAFRIVESGVKTVKLNIGGLHFEMGKKSFTTYIFLSDEDIEYAKKIIAFGVNLEGREIPGSPSINIDNLIK